MVDGVLLDPRDQAVDALDDTAAVLEDGAISGSVLANDSVPDLVRSVELVSGPANGVLVLNLDGSYTYTPGAAFDSLAQGETATESFTYRVTDADGDSDTATVTITITGTNDGPVAVVDAVSGNENQALTIDVLANDSDVDHGAVLSVSAASVAAGQGTVSINADNTLAYDPGTDFDHLALGESATVTIDYSIVDEHGASASATVAVTVAGTNDGPVAVADTAGGDENQALTIDVLANDNDVDDGAVLSVSAASVAAGQGTASINADNTLAYDPGTDFDHLALGESATVTIGYTASDEHGATSDATVAVTVTGINDDPSIFAQDLTGAVTELSGSLARPQTSLAASYLTMGNTLVNGLGGTRGFGEYFLPANDDGSTGAINITSVFGASGINFFGHNYTSLYVNNNGNITFNGPLGSYTPSSIAAGIGGPIIAPFWADVDTRGATSISPGGNSTGSNLVWYDLDATNGVMTITWDDVGYYSLGSTPNAFQVQLISEGSGDFDIVYRYEEINWTTGNASGGSGGLGGTPARAGYNAQDGVHYFELPQSGNQAQMLALESAGTSVFNVRAGDVVSSDLTDSGTIQFADVDLSDVHLVSANGTPLGTTLGSLTATLNHDTTGTGSGGQLTWIYTVANSAVEYLGEGETRVESFTITLDDQHGGLITRQIDVTITGNNDAPVITSSEQSGTVSEGDPLHGAAMTATGQVTWADANAGDVHSLTISTAPLYGAASVAADGHWTYTVSDSGAVDQLGVGEHLADSFTVTVDDGEGGIATQSISIDIVGTNDAPTVVADLFISDEDTAVSGNVLTNDSDVDGDALTVAAGTFASAHGSVTIAANGEFTYTPQANYYGADSFSYTANDGHGGTASATVSLTIEAVNDAPVAVADAFTLNEDATIVGNVLANDSDAEGDALTVTTTGTIATAHGSVTMAANGDFTYTPDANYHGSDEFTYEVSDAQGGLGSGTVDLTIASVNDAPVAVNDSLSTNENAVLTVSASDLLLNDTDIDGDALSVASIAGTSALGVSTVFSGGVLTYNPTTSPSLQALRAGESATD
ncbi:MAG: Ig-like domain-containing protein, partial [Betaproteobacteria bacterium]|nr:Ig-like domain-containing protein [Betaproteobacteria bacterium]